MCSVQGPIFLISPHRTTPHCTAPHRTAPHRTAPHRTAPHRTAPHRTAPHRTAPHRTAPHRTAPRRTAPHRAQCTQVLELESKLEEGRADAAKTLSEIVRVQTQKEELVANLEAKRMAHEQAVVSLAVHLGPA
jgi:hypothetical protein